MRSYKFYFNSKSYMELSYDFDLKKYYDGDGTFRIVINNREKYVFVTEVIYFSQALLNIIKMTLDGDRRLENPDTRRLVSNYVAHISGKNYDMDYHYKYLFEGRHGRNKDIVTFLFVKEKIPYLIITELTKKRTRSEASYIDFEVCGRKLVYKKALSRKTLRDWKEPLHEILSQRINATFDDLVTKYCIQSVGIGYADMIISRDNFVDAVNDFYTLGYRIMEVSWWKHNKIGEVLDNFSMGGPIDKRNEEYFWGETNFNQNFENYYWAENLEEVVRYFCDFTRTDENDLFPSITLDVAFDK